MIEIFDRRESKWFMWGGGSFFPKNLFISWSQFGWGWGGGGDVPHSCLLLGDKLCFAPPHFFTLIQYFFKVFYNKKMALVEESLLISVHHCDVAHAKCHNLMHSTYNFAQTCFTFRSPDYQLQIINSMQTCNSVTFYSMKRLIFWYWQKVFCQPHCG